MQHDTENHMFLFDDDERAFLGITHDLSASDPVDVLNQVAETHRRYVDLGAAICGLPHGPEKIAQLRKQELGLRIGTRLMSEVEAVLIGIR